MSVDRTEIEWPYEPADYFEAPYRYSAREFAIVIDAGKAVAMLTPPQNPVPADLEGRVKDASSPVVSTTRDKFIGTIDGPNPRSRQVLFVVSAGPRTRFQLGSNFSKQPSVANEEIYPMSWIAAALAWWAQVRQSRFFVPIPWIPSRIRDRLWHELNPGSRGMS